MKKPHLANATQWDIDDPMDMEVLELWVRDGNVDVLRTLAGGMYADGKTSIGITPATREWAKEAAAMAALAKAAG